MGQFYGEISVIFFLSFRLKTAFSLPFGVFVSTSRERRMFIFERSRLFLEEFLLLFFLVVVAKYFFFAERKQAEQLFKFCFFVCLFFFSSFVSHERDLRFFKGEKSSHTSSLYKARFVAHRAQTQNAKAHDIRKERRFFLSFASLSSSF